MGIKHANRIEECLRQRLRDDPARDELDEFFAEDREERFFVKNLERVQGDERDAIILSIGYGKNHERRPAATASARCSRRRRAAPQRRGHPRQAAA